MSNSSNDFSQAPASKPPAAKKSSGRSLTLLGVGLVLTALAAYAIPKVLTNMYLAEEEAKRKSANIVGTRTDSTPPPGVQVYGMGGGGGGGGAAGDNAGGATPADAPADGGSAPADGKTDAADAASGDGATSDSAPSEPKEDKEVGEKKDE